MVIKRVIALFAFSICLFVAVAQQKGIVVSFSQVPANIALIELRQKYGFGISFNDSELAKYPVTFKGQFNTVDDMLGAFFAAIPFSIEKMGDVYVVLYDAAKDQPSLLSTVTVRGKVSDATTGEVLPYGTVSVNGELRIADVGGNFSFVAFTDEWLQIKVTYMGFVPCDTLLAAQPWIDCKLKPTVNELSETVVIGSASKMNALMGQSIGQVKTDPRMANYLPGDDNNAITQLISMHPGIQSAGASFGQMSIWGSYPGQNLLTFDGMTLFTYPFSSELLFPVSAQLVKSIRIDKGALGATDGNRIGGVVELIGVDGRTDKPELSLSADGTVLTVFSSVPATQGGSLVTSFRKTIAPHYFDAFGDQSAYRESDQMDVWKPFQCDYHDYFLKYSRQKGNGDRFYASVYGNGSSREIRVDPSPDIQWHYQNHENWEQNGFSLFYGHTWANGVNSNIRATGTHADWAQDVSSPFASPSPPTTENRQGVEEYTVSFDNRFALNSKQFVEVGAQYYQTFTQFDFPATSNPFRLSSSIQQASAFMRNHIVANSKLLMDIGLRMDYVFRFGEFFFQPRLKGELELTPNLKMNFNWGVYNQFLAFVPLIDGDGNREYIWHGMNEKTDFLQSNVLALGAVWVPGWVNLKAEVYLKEVDGLSMYQSINNLWSRQIGHSSTWGIDLLAKKEFGRLAFWQSVTWGKTLEKFPNESSYTPSYFSRLAEAKSTCMVYLAPFKIGLTYVAATSNAKNIYANNLVGDFRRLDATMSSSVELKKLLMDFGVTGYNLLDRPNVSSLNVNHIMVSESKERVVGFGGMPFFVNVFLKISY